MNKTGLLIGGAVVALLVLLFVWGITITNGTINVEEQVMSADATIKTEEKRRIDLILNLVDVVEQYATYESETLAKVVELRSAAQQGVVTGDVQMTFNAVMEAYPELKANEVYKNLMLELASTENRIAEVRKAFNTEVRQYNKYIRRFPNSFVLGLTGYEELELTYLDFDAPVDAPQDLFKKGN